MRAQFNIGMIDTNCTRFYYCNTYDFDVHVPKISPSTIIVDFRRRASEDINTRKYDIWIEFVSTYQFVAANYYFFIIIHLGNDIFFNDNDVGNYDNDVLPENFDFGNKLFYNILCRFSKFK